MEDIVIRNLCKSFAGKPVLRDFSAVLPVGQVTGLMAPSGAGKTTLLRILMGLERPDGGTIDGLAGLRLSAVFQEDRLCESFSPIENVAMCAGRRSRLPVLNGNWPACFRRNAEPPVSTLSGGMKRRVAVARALLIPSHILLMDEPFTGMDDELKRNVISYIREKQDGRLLILSTHQEEDVELIGGELVRLENCMDV